MTSIWHHLTYTSLSLKCSFGKEGLAHSIALWIQVFQPTVQPTSKKAAWCAFKAASLKDLGSICTVGTDDDCLTNQKMLGVLFVVGFQTKPKKQKVLCFCSPFYRLLAFSRKPPTGNLSKWRVLCWRDPNKGLQAKQEIHSGWPMSSSWSPWMGEVEGIPTKMWKMKVWIIQTAWTPAISWEKSYI